MIRQLPIARCSEGEKKKTAMSSKIVLLYQRIRKKGPCGNVNNTYNNFESGARVLTTTTTTTNFEPGQQNFCARGHRFYGIPEAENIEKLIRRNHRPHFYYFV
jgi:hypothetical protein